MLENPSEIQRGPYGNSWVSLRVLAGALAPFGLQRLVLDLFDEYVGTKLKTPGTNELDRSVQSEVTRCPTHRLSIDPLSLECLGCPLDFIQ